MKLNVFVFKNSILGCSGNPRFDDHEPEVFAKGIERMLITADADRVAQFENTTVYHIGEYDDETLRFKPVQDPVLLLDCNLVLEARKVKYEILAKIREKKEEEAEKDVQD